MKKGAYKVLYLIPFLIIILAGIPNSGYGQKTIKPEPPPGVQDPNTLHLTGPAFLAKIKLWKKSDTTVDFLLTGRCNNYKFNEEGVIANDQHLPTGKTWDDLDKEFFESNGWDWSFSSLYFECGWFPNQYGTQWILASPVAVPSYSEGEDGNGEFIEVSVVYLGRLLISSP